MLKDLFELMYERKFKVLSSVFAIIAIVLIARSAYVIVGLNDCMTLDELKVNTLRSGQCVRDEVSYTYGDIAAWVSGKEQVYTYVLDIGGNHDQFINVLLTKKADMAGKVTFDDLTKMIPGYYEERYSKKSVKFYGIVETTDKSKFPYSFYTNVFGETVGQIKKHVSTDYQIRVIEPKTYRNNIIIGVFLFFVAGIILIYEKIYDKNKEESDLEEVEKNGKIVKVKKIKGPFTKGLAAESFIICVTISNKYGYAKINDRNKIDEITEYLDKAVEYINEKKVIEEMYKLEFELDDCSYYTFYLYDDCLIKYMGGYYKITQEAHEGIINAIEGAMK